MFTKWFRESLAESREKLNIPLAEGSRRRSATIKTATTANVFSGIIIKISSNLESIPVSELAEAIASSKCS